MNPSTDPATAEATAFQEGYVRVREAVGKAIVGQHRAVDGVLTAILAGGNVLLEGVPGLGKTELIKAFAKALDLDFRRVQFTPDLMPADIVGTNVMNAGPDGRYQFDFRKGPIFTQLLLADEINRATPKTQAALLETMQEGSVTAGGETYQLKQPFFVLATQNPIEQEGTYPLPEAQIDRFMFKITVPFLNRAELGDVLRRTALRAAVAIDPVLNGDQIMELRALLNKVVVADPFTDFAVRLTLATHPDSEYAPEMVRRFVRWGASPRATQALIRAARVRALSEGRTHVAFEDIRAFAHEVLNHRVLLNYDGIAESISPTKMIDAIVAHVPEQAA
jgi:MoxR-like ATPase